MHALRARGKGCAGAGRSSLGGQIISVITAVSTGFPSGVHLHVARVGRVHKTLPNSPPPHTLIQALSLYPFCCSQNI